MSGNELTILDHFGLARYRASAAVNPAAEIGVSINTLRISLSAAFAAYARLQWAGLGKASFGWAGAGVPERQPCPCARPPRLASGGGMLTATPEGTMNTICRALSRLFPTRRLAFSLYRRRTISALSMIGGAA